jgi:hypothetical protein
MKKSRVNDQAYQDVTHGSDANTASDISTREVNFSEATSDHIIDDQDIAAVPGTQKKSYAKPTLIVYHTERELAKGHGPKFRWRDLFTK